MESFSTIHFNNNYLYFDKDADFPKYLLDANKNLLLGQLFDFQIHHLCSHFDVPIHNEFGSILPNHVLVKELEYKKFQSTLFECHTCDLLGIGSSINKTKNKFIYNNIGGKPIHTIQLDVSQNYIVPTKNDQIFEESTESVEILLSIDNCFNIYDVEPEHTQIMIDEGVQKKNRKMVALEHNRMGTTLIDKLGKIDYTTNSSYIDNILMLYFLPLDQSFFVDTLSIENKIPKLNDPTFILQHFNVKMKKTEIKNKIISLNNLLIKYNDEINEGNIITSQQFSIALQTNFAQPRGILTHPYFYTKKTYPIFDFYKDMLKLNLVDNHPFTSLTKTFIKLDDPNLYSGGAELPPTNEILGSVELGKNGHTEHIGFEVDDTIINYLIRRDQYRLPKKNKAYCFICNEYIDLDLFKKSHLDFHRRNNQIILSNLMNFQIDLIQDEIVPASGYAIKIIDNKNVVYEIANPTNVMTEQEAVANSAAQLYKRVIYEYLIKDTQCISFYINRIIKRINKKTLQEETFLYKMKVKLEKEIVDDDSITYQLSAIITKENENYLLFFCSDQIWYVYNSNFNPEEQSDYIIQIGSFKDLSMYDQGKVETMGMIYFYLKINN